MSTLLSYAVSTDPDPLQASPLSGAISYGAITIVVSNSSSDSIYCNQIQFSFPEGTLAQDLTNVDSSIAAAISPSTWTITPDLNGLYTATPTSPANNAITTTSGLVVEIYNIQVNQEPGSVTLTIDETASNTNSGTFPLNEGTYTLAKFPYGFFFDSFAPNAPQIADNGTVTLTWNASDGPTYTLYYGSTSVDVTEARTWTSPALDSDTTFLLQASYQYQGQTIVTSLTTSVNVGDPDLTVSSLTVNTGGSVTTPSIGAASPAALSIPSPLSMLQPPVTLQVPPMYTNGWPTQNYTYTYSVSTDGLFVAYIGGGTPPTWASLAVSCTYPNGVSINAQVSGQDSGATTTVIDQQFSSLVLPLQNGSTFNLNLWGGQYGPPLVNAYFFPFGNGTATQTGQS